ncbi:Glyoxalase-like domain protein [Phycisphaerae bacterium RAS2]|nr:Glyoxalase-like domain protein [Phycisphaerae bacterium RAS2]
MTTTPADTVYEVIPMVHVADVEASIAFYALLGFSVRDKVQHAGKTQWAWITSGRGHLMLTAASGPVDPRQQAVLFYLYCENIAMMRAHLLANGLADGGAFGHCEEGREPSTDEAARRSGCRTVFEISHPFYMPEGELRVHDPDGYCLLIGQCAIQT